MLSMNIIDMLYIYIYIVVHIVGYTYSLCMLILYICHFQGVGAERCAGHILSTDVFSNDI